MTRDLNPICMNVTFHSCWYFGVTLYPFLTFYVVMRPWRSCFSQLFAVQSISINWHVTYYCVSCHTLWEEVLSRCGTRDLCTSFPLWGIWQICASVPLECADQQAVEVSFPVFPLPVSTHTDPTMRSLSQALKLTCIVLVSLVSYQQNFLHCSLKVKWFDLCVSETGQHYERKCIFPWMWFHI